MISRSRARLYYYCGIVSLVFRPQTSATSIENCDFNSDSYMRRGIALEDETFWSTTTIDELECARHCVKRRVCQSFNFDTELKLCELNEGVLADNKTQRTGINLRYSNISVWPSQIEPNCFDRPCEDDEVCIPTQFNGGISCSHTCFKLPFRCPLPDGISSNQPRTVGSSLHFTCDRGYVGGDSAVCLNSGRWDKDINKTCTPLHGSSCNTDEECLPINGSCHQNSCQCLGLYVYDANETNCVKTCEADWIQFDDKCYHFTQNEMSYPDAMTFCANNGSSLVQVDSLVENEFLRDIMRNTYPPPSTGYWNDLFQMTTNDNEIWRTTGNSLTFSGFAGENPDDYQGPESCTVFWVSVDYAWVDISCENSVRTDGQTYGYPPSRAVCEKYL